MHCPCDKKHTVHRNHLQMCESCMRFDIYTPNETKQNKQGKTNTSDGKNTLFPFVLVLEKQIIVNIV